MKVVLITGGFDPLHTGHISYINAARKLAGEDGKLIVGVNSDEWLKSKKDYVVLTRGDRAEILANLSDVDMVIGFNDKDGTATDALKAVKKIHPKEEIIFANGGNRTRDNTPETKVKGVIFKFGVGAAKANSSSDLISAACDQLKEIVDRKWGIYSILYSRTGVKVKELIIKPGKSISLQKHEFRSESWQVIAGQLEVGVGPSVDELDKLIISPGDIMVIPCGAWHVLKNVSNIPAVIIEIQTGSQCNEMDIIREKA